MQPDSPARYCPRCGERYADPGSLVQELWVGRATTYHCWCRACWFTCDITEVRQVVAHEAAG